ncbi:DUF4129 domain-containing protein [Christiangramia aquimixticola]|uniref:DUF4129 domain-containing protein n=1 Tax=Christiangramia aquimixticola TaxID=1697558 RepID=UPI003AA9D722
MKTLYFLLLLLSCYSGYSQVSEADALPLRVKTDESQGLLPLTFDRNKLEEYKSREEFQYLQIEEKANWWTRFKSWLNHKYNQLLSWIFGEYEAKGFLAMLISILPFLLILGLLILIIWLFSKLDPGGKILQKPAAMEVFLSDEEELIKNEDLDSLIKNAVKNQNYRLAVRYHYLKELRRLDELNIIEYQYQKTNKEYVLEIVDLELRNLFLDITKLYEFIWYGNFRVSEGDYHLAEAGFNNLDHRLNSAGNE